jgi:hypothetical protein
MNLTEVKEQLERYQNLSQLTDFYHKQAGEDSAKYFNPNENNALIWTDEFVAWLFNEIWEHKKVALELIEVFEKLYNLKGDCPYQNINNACLTINKHCWRCPLDWAINLNKEV